MRGIIFDVHEHICHLGTLGLLTALRETYLILRGQRTVRMDQRSSPSEGVKYIYSRVPVELLKSGRISKPPKRFCESFLYLDVSL